MKKIIVVFSCCLFSANLLMAQAKTNDVKAGARTPVPLADAPRVNGDNTPAIGTTKATVNSISMQAEAVAIPVAGQPTDAVQNGKLVPVTKETSDNKIQMPSGRSHPRKVRKSN
jgi:hypothetical protein